MGGPQCYLLTDTRKGTTDSAVGDRSGGGRHGNLHADLGVLQSDIQIIQGLLHLLCVLNQRQVLFL